MYHRCYRGAAAARRAGDRRLLPGFDREAAQGAQGRRGSQHLQQNIHAGRRPKAFLRAWAKEDVYFTLDRETELLREAGFDVDVVWRRDSFAVIVALN